MGSREDKEMRKVKDDGIRINGSKPCKIFDAGSRE
jgi:hypothetical protein